ncbi:hypothetical protein LIQ13_06040 [Blautia luti]|uniref:hypothetical protein n=1 Tax=Blautia luti TaxID=89014 RepID=UPI001D02523F|nr:hypothetical protein [Blautia luti]MCB5474294.1 hypothetical protein [Blautia luti]
MKKYNRKQVMGMTIIGTIMVCSACGRTEAAVPDVVSSMKMNRDEMLTVVANQDKIEDKEAFAWLLLQMCKDNSFESIKFSMDEGYPTSLDMNVYAWKEDIGEKDPIMTVEYKPEEGNVEYDIVNAPEQFHLYVDDEMVEDN